MIYNSSSVVYYGEQMKNDLWSNSFSKLPTIPIRDRGASVNSKPSEEI